MPKCKVIVTDKAQPCTRNERVESKELGNYTPLLRTITLFNKTAVKKTDSGNQNTCRCATA